MLVAVIQNMSVITRLPVESILTVVPSNNSKFPILVVIEEGEEILADRLIFGEITVKQARRF